jgi:gas vesicle protein
MSDHDDTPYIVIERRSGGMGAFLWGAIIGAGVALLYAPRAGEQTREELRTGALRLKGRAEDTVRSLQDSVADTVDNLRGEVTDRIDSARDAFDAGRDAARETREDLERRVRETRERVRASAESRRTAPVAEATTEPTAGTESDVGI